MRGRGACSCVFGKETSRWRRVIALRLTALQSESRSRCSGRLRRLRSSSPWWPRKRSRTWAVAVPWILKPPRTSNQSGKLASMPWTRSLLPQRIVDSAELNVICSSADRALFSSNSSESVGSRSQRSRTRTAGYPGTGASRGSGRHLSSSPRRCCRCCCCRCCGGEEFEDAERATRSSSCVGKSSPGNVGSRMQCGTVSCAGMRSKTRHLASRSGSQPRHSTAASSVEVTRPRPPSEFSGSRTSLLSVVAHWPTMESPRYDSSKTAMWRTDEGSVMYMASGLYANTGEACFMIVLDRRCCARTVARAYVDGLRSPCSAWSRSRAARTSTTRRFSLWVLNTVAARGANASLPARLRISAAARRAPMAATFRRPSHCSKATSASAISNRSMFRTPSMREFLRVLVLSSLTAAKRRLAWSRGNGDQTSKPWRRPRHKSPTVIAKSTLTSVAAHRWSRHHFEECFGLPNMTCAARTSTRTRRERSHRPNALANVRAIPRSEA
mmetsp:Transcript_20677/g.65020  ORF Transcript_20677/g.65020 Transcript_20677/m.65020 type:complete len:498 (-) Transcript_20677:804-2297(-)